MADERVQFFFLGVVKNKTNERGTSEGQANEFLSYNKRLKTNLHHSPSLPSPSGK